MQHSQRKREREEEREITLSLGWKQGWMIPFISKYQLSNFIPLGVGLKTSTRYNKIFRLHTLEIKILLSILAEDCE